ncbi:MAG: class I SAM-dependent methyltransferase [[Eubacterium] siraeum]|nr:class I SAM-dependent methyltransferase [[Eubacterium] siraeum]
MPIRLDERLTAVANLVDYGTVADVGCDHGKLGFYLLGTERASGVIATDISEGSLQKASRLAYDNDLSMQTRLGDGLKPIGDGEVDTVVIAGLGGDAISDIFAGARADKKKFKHFVLSPNTHPEKVRRELILQGHTIVFDDVTECSGKRYDVIKTDVGESALDELQIAFGAFYAENEKFLKYAKEELAYKQGILLNHASQELEKRVSLLKRAISIAGKNYEN